MLANTADTGSVEHNTADATLWFVHALGRHVDTTGDIDLAHELTPALRDLYDRHVTGTRYGIQVDPVDGLLRQGAPGEALTWMDARVDGEPITQRAGKAVDINALWCNALGVLDALGVLPDRRHYDAAVASFRVRFPRGGFLLDAAEPDDSAVRPNQLLAYSLPYAPMPPDRDLILRVADELLTPLGLRSLSPADPAYRRHHRGGPADRDRAYHQGTVWPWLIGPMADAMRKAGLPLDGLFDGLHAHLPEAGLGSISETADGDAPHTPTGCPFQAWSVAEYTRAHTPT
jgi:predicted glycogen debranching enzyme